MKLTENLAAIHAYLCADGYVIRNKGTQKHKYYVIGLRNTNRVLLKDFQEKFTQEFGLKPHIVKDGRCRIQNREIYEKLTREFSTFYSKEWSMPKMSKHQASPWLRAYFDCDGGVGFVKANYDRKIGLESINFKGINQIRKQLEKLGITSTIHKHGKRKIWVLTICGKDDLSRFEKEIGFLHPKKVARLRQALESYKNYAWRIPNSKEDLLRFVKKKGRIRKERHEMRVNSIIKKNLVTIKTRLTRYGIKSKIYGPWRNPQQSKWYCLILKINGQRGE